MRSQVATGLTHHEGDDADIGPPRPRLVAASGEEVVSAVAIASGELRPRVGDPQAWRDQVHRVLVGVADMLSATTAVLVVLIAEGTNHVALAALVGVPLLAVLFKLSGLYDRDELRLAHSTLDEAPILLQLTGIFALAVGIPWPAPLASHVGGGQIAMLWIAAFVAVLGGRVMARSIGHRLSPVERSLVIGGVEDASALSKKLAADRARATIVACMPLGAVDVTRAESAAMIRDAVHDLRIQRIIIAPTTADTESAVELIRIARAAGVSVSVIPQMFEAVGSAVEFDEIGGVPVLGIRRFGLSRPEFLTKRAFDICVTSAGLVAISPVLLAIAGAIRLDSKGPVFFRQVRVGRDGKHFRIFKFRSMIADAEMRKEALRSLNEAGDGLFKLADDPRVTRVGRFLRRTSLDELPQLFNVLSGEMSLVGPRPLVTDEDEQVLGLDRSRLHLTPGMTGPWQVLASRVPLKEMVGIDYLYVANWSLWLDVKILLKTIRHVARRGNI